ncbi:MAG TPA: hypothetical protein PL048_17410 [Leptospiraceae bacterium]|nr:hypothetical protein [Leptospiraceae bacterium]HMY68574.1 hypothetical protein [Leptospiraceae bacterium]HMZ60556.1 hypothetical protein [Leptospiraceae bacterium]HNF15677.1 hypothetical protein [Leptospiraceae bacterium]HNF25127.1 hypothetical protein [Leptospiraceae bacterium]
MDFRQKLFSFTVLIFTGGCVTWELGKVGYIEPSKLEIEPAEKKLILSECSFLSGGPFLERAVEKAEPGRLKNAVIIKELRGTTSCYRLYGEKESQ